MKKKIILIIGLIVIISAGLFVYEMLPFVKGIQVDIREGKHHIHENDTTIIVDKSQLDAIETNPLMQVMYSHSVFRDTVIQINDNNKIKIKRIDSLEIIEYFIDKKIIDSICLVEGNRHSEAIGIENYQSKKYGEYFKRDSTGFYVKLKNGMWNKLILESEIDETDHTFEYFFKDFEFYSIRVQWGEGNGYKLVNYSTGEVTSIIGRPYFSPNGKYLISVNADLEAGYSENGFQLFENNKGILKELIFHEPDLWGPFSVKWIDKSTVIMKNEGIEFENDTMRNFEFYTEIKIINAG